MSALLSPKTPGEYSKPFEFEGQLWQWTPKGRRVRFTPMPENLVAEFDRDKNFIDPNLVSAGSNISYWWVGLNCKHSWDTKVSNRASGSRCPICYGSKRVAKGVNSLWDTEPSIAKMLANPEDGYSVTRQSGKSLDWICPQGHHVTVVVSNMVKAVHNNQNGYSCNICSNRVVVKNNNSLWDTDPELASQLKNPEEGYLVSRMSSKVLEWVCNKGHEWSTGVNRRSTSKTRKNYSGCPVCDGRKVIQGVNDLWTTVPIVAEFLVNKDLGFTVSTNSAKITEWSCGEHYWTKSIVGMVSGFRNNNTLCVYCSGTKLWPGSNDLATKFPEIVKSLKDSTIASRITSTHYKKVTWLCDKGHEFQRTPYSYVIEKITSCPVCTNRQLVVGINDLATTHSHLAAELEDTTLATQLTAGKKNKVWWVCPKGHRYHTSPAIRTKNHSGCPKCAHVDSYFERLIREAIEEITDEKLLLRKMPLKTDRGNNRELDIWIPSLYIAFEVQDFSTHSRTSDTEPQQAWSKGNLTYKHGPAYHAEKRKLAKDQLDVNLYEIWEDEILDGTYRQKVSDIITQAISCQKTHKTFQNP